MMCLNYCPLYTDAYSPISFPIHIFFRFQFPSFMLRQNFRLEFYIYGQMCPSQFWYSAQCTRYQNLLEGKPLAAKGINTHKSMHYNILLFFSWRESLVGSLANPHWEKIVLLNFRIGCLELCLLVERVLLLKI